MNYHVGAIAIAIPCRAAWGPPVGLDEHSNSGASGLPKLLQKPLPCSTTPTRYFMDSSDLSMSTRLQSDAGEWLNSLVRNVIQRERHSHESALCAWDEPDSSDIEPATPSQGRFGQLPNLARFRHLR
jgi:hypothetical protein